MFVRNEKVVYPGHGVAVISRILEKNIAGKNTKFFELHFLNKDMTIFVPVDNAIAVGIRPLCSMDNINDIFSLLSQPPIDHHNEILINWNKRNKEYQGKLRRGDLREICIVYRDLKHIETHKELSFGEKSLLQQTELLLVEEISIVKKVEAANVAEQVRSLVERGGAFDYAKNI